MKKYEVTAQVGISYIVEALDEIEAVKEFDTLIEENNSLEADKAEITSIEEIR